MFGRKKQKYIEGFGNVQCLKNNCYITTTSLLGNLYEVSLYIESDSQNDNFNEAQESSFKDYVAKREKIEDYIKEYYIENYNEIIEDYYTAYGENWEASCRTKEELKKIVDSYNAQNKDALKILLSYFKIQSIEFFKNGNYALIGFVATSDDHGIAITINPRWEIMTQDEYHDEYPYS